MSKVSHQYAMHKNADDDYWTIFDIHTGLPAVLDDVPMDKLDEMEAVEVLELVAREIIHIKSAKQTSRSLFDFPVFPNL